MTCKVIDFTKDTVVYHIIGASRAELDNSLTLFFSAENLRMVKDSADEKIFQKGSKIGRLLLGVFIKYFRLAVSVKQENDLFAVEVKRDMNLLASGGLVGLNAARKEFDRLNEAFKNYFNR